MVDRSQVSTEKIKLTSPSDQFDILLPVKADGQDKLRIEMPFFYCQTGDTGVCKFGQVAFEIDLTVSGSSKMDRVQLEFDVTD